MQKSRKLCDKDAEHEAVTSKSVRDLAQKAMDEINGLRPGDLALPTLTLAEYSEKHYLPWAEAKLKPSTGSRLQTSIRSTHQTALRQASPEEHHNADGN